jgi:hypothetical protein
MKKRILVLLTMMALMIVMLAMSVAPAFATWDASGCRSGSLLVSVTDETQAAKDKNNNDFVCQVLRAQRVNYYDDHPQT